MLNSQKLLDSEKEELQRIIQRQRRAEDYQQALQFLCVCLQKEHGKKVLILIDEYDVPLENVYFRGFYDEMIGFLRSLFESALKTNEALEFAVLTGCLRISMKGNGLHPE